MQGDQRLDAVGPQACEHLAVARESGSAPLAPLRFDATPFEGETQARYPEIAGAGEIIFGAGPPIAGCARAFAGKYLATLLPLVPLTGGVVPFHLIGRGRYAPDESWREGQYLFLGIGPS